MGDLACHATDERHLTCESTAVPARHQVRANAQSPPHTQGRQRVGQAGTRPMQLHSNMSDRPAENLTDRGGVEILHLPQLEHFPQPIRQPIDAAADRLAQLI